MCPIDSKGRKIPTEKSLFTCKYTKCQSNRNHRCRQSSWISGRSNNKVRKSNCRVRGSNKKSGDSATESGDPTTELKDRPTKPEDSITKSGDPTAMSEDPIAKSEDRTPESEEPTILSQDPNAKSNNASRKREVGAEFQNNLAMANEQGSSLNPLFPIALLMLYIFAGGAMCQIYIQQDQDWGGYWNVIYFICVSLTSIGFGDFVPQGTRVGISCFLYVMFGMVLIAACVISVKEFFSVIVAKYKKRKLAMVSNRARVVKN